MKGDNQKMKLILRWRIIPSFPEYEVSINGRIRRAVDSLPRANGGVLKKGFERKIQKGPDTYRSILLISGEHKKTCMVHRLVLEAFVGPCPPGCECNHKDGDKSNNNKSNLEWVTPSENQKHAYKMGLSIPKDQRGEKNASAKLKAGEVWLIRKLLKSDLHLSKKRKQKDRLLQYQIAKMFKVSFITISDIKRRRSWNYI